MDPICESYLYAASRAQSLRFVVKPVLERGGFIVSDRNFLSSLSNQSSGRGIKSETIWDINRVAIEGFMPDLVFYIDLTPEVSIKRAADTAGDKFESLGLAYHTKVRRGYLNASKDKRLNKGWVTIDGSQSVDDIHNDILKAFHDFYSKNS